MPACTKDVERSCPWQQDCVAEIYMANLNAYYGNLGVTP